MGIQFASNEPRVANGEHGQELAVNRRAGAPSKAAVTKTIGKLPGMIKQAAAQLATAVSAAEVLDVIDTASFTYSTAQKAGRIAKAKGAHDKVVGAAHRAQADALEIEAEAKRRLADEYDGGQERGEIAKGSVRSDIVPQQNDVRPATAAEAGVSRKEIHAARRVRNAEAKQPGVVKAALDKAIAEKQEPTRALVNAAVAEALGETKPPKPARSIFDELVALWREASTQDREEFVAYLRVAGVITEPAGAAVSAGTDLREPAAAAPGQIVREGDAPREPARQAGEKSQGGGVSSPDTEHVSPAVPTATAKADTATPSPVSATSLKTMSKAEQIRLLRPNCKHPDDLDKCSGVGRAHCHDCRRSAESEAA